MSMHRCFSGKLISHLGITKVGESSLLRLRSIQTSFFTIVFQHSQQLLDHKSYYLNITDANLTNKPKWQLEYTVKVCGNTGRLLPWKPYNYLTSGIPVSLISRPLPSFLSLALRSPA